MMCCDVAAWVGMKLRCWLRWVVGDAAMLAAVRLRWGGNDAMMRLRCGGDEAAVWLQCWLRWGGNDAAMRLRCGGDEAAV